MTMLEARIFKGKDGTTTYYTVDSNGLKQGIYLQYRKSTTVKLLCHYENDMLHGSHTVYYPTGEIQTKEEYKNNLLDGEQIYHLEDKQLLLQNVSNGKKVSEKLFRCCNYSGNLPLKQVLQQSTQYNANGIIHGDQLEYFSNGKSVARCKKYDNGVLVEESVYNANGIRIAHTLYTIDGFVKTETYKGYSYNSTTVTTKTKESLTEIINYTLPGDLMRLQQIFSISKYSYRDKIPKELWDKIVTDCVTRNVTIDGVTTYKKVDPNSLYPISTSKISDTEVVYRWRYSYETGTIKNKKKTGDYVKEWIELCAVYNLINDTCTVSQHTTRKEEKYYVDGKAFGFFKITDGQAVKEYFRFGTRNIKWSEAVEMFNKESNSELTESDIAFIKLKYN